MKAILLGIVLSICCVKAVNASVTVDDLYVACANKKTAQVAKVICDEYLSGIIDGITAQAVISNRNVFFCASEHTTVEEFSSVFLKGVEEDAGLKAAPNAGIVVAILLQRNFPCKQRKS